MSESDSNPASVPLLFPDPVIEYYLTKIDRAAIREQLRKTPGERLRSLENKGGDHDQRLTVLEKLPLSPRKPKLDMGVEPAWFAEAEAVPLLFPDPVIDAYLIDVDRGLIREQLKLDPAGRLQCLESMADFYESARRIQATSANA